MLISFGGISKYVVYPLVIIFIIPGINQAKRLLETPIRTEYFLITSIGIMFLAEMCIGCLHFLPFYNKPQSKREYQELKLKRQLQMKKRSKIKRKFSYFHKKLPRWVNAGICGLGLLDLVSTIINYAGSSLLIKDANGLGDLVLFIQFYIYILCSVLILHQEIYRHHYLSIGINFIGAIFALVPLIISDFQYVNILVSIGRNCLNGILYVLSKWFMNFKNIDVYYLLLIQGIFGFSLFLILLGIEFIFCPSDIMVWYCNEITIGAKITKEGIYYILIEFVRFLILNICYFQTIWYYSPLHLLATLICSRVFYWAIDMIKGEEFEHLTLIGFVIIIIANLIFNEVMILHFCKMDFNTKAMISNRSTEKDNMCISAYNTVELATDTNCE